jgi:protein-S-isoprenylcysteine O-methyltransferase Ste14
MNPTLPRWRASGVRVGVEGKMDNELIFRLILIALLFFLGSFRLYYHFKAGTVKESQYTDIEGKPLAALRGLFAIPWFVSLFVYTFYPAGMQWAQLPLPFWLRWVGVGLTTISVLFIAWTNYALDKNFSTTLRVRDNHTLVMVGPYRWVRHPMYSAILIMLIGMGLLSANWFIGGLSTLSFIPVIMILRTRKEEAMLVDKFGDAYRAYQQSTGQFIPRWSR